MKPTQLFSKNQNKLFQTCCLVLTILSFCNNIFSQVRNLYVEGEGNQSGVIHSVSASGSAGLELVRGTELDLTDWRIYNEEGNFRIQSAIDNFTTNGTSRISILEDGNVGIGTNFPESRLHIVGGTDVDSVSGGYLLMGNLTGTNMGIDNNEIQARNNGVVANLYLQNGGGKVSVGASGADTHGTVTIEGHTKHLHIRNNDVGGANWWFGASDDSWTVGGSKFVFDDDGSSGDPILMLDAESEGVAIGFNSVPTGYTFAVDGNMICEEVRVDLSGDWPDYVFEEDYNLLSIEALEKSIRENGHLPGIPAAAEIEAEGIALGDMQKRMVEKIEELSLYIIQLEHRISDLETSKK